ncbi:MAG: hypothetical protein WAN76_07475 [Candidatus Sulfotelmatobacter sp.]
MKRSILVLVVVLWAGLSFISCGGRAKSKSPSGYLNRVLASQGVFSSNSRPGLVLIDAYYNVLPSIPPIGAGNSPGLMAISPSRNIVAAFDASSNSVYAADTVKEADIGSVHLAGPTSSMVVPTSTPVGYAAVPTATIQGFSFTGALQVMNFAGGGLTTSIAVTNAQTVISNANGTQLLVFSNDSNSVTVLSPGAAVPPVDTSCLTNPPNAVCTIVPGFDRPVYGIINGNTAYILNCGPQCGGVQASVMVFDLPTLTIANTIPVDAATWAVLNGSTLYVAGTSPTNHACTGQTTAATICGRLDIVDLNSGKVTGSAVITDGYHWRMDLTNNNQIFIGSYNCTNIGNVNNPSGEVRGCLSIYKIADNSVVVPPDNGNVGGLQGFTSRYFEYVAEDGNLRVYDTTKDILYINFDLLPEGTLNIVGYVGDVKAIDFF